jgi:hypothetical protein
MDGDLANLDPTQVTWEDGLDGDDTGRQRCCNTCGQNEDCAAAIYLNENYTFRKIVQPDNFPGITGNCFLYNKPVGDQLFPMDGVSLCAMPLERGAQGKLVLWRGMLHDKLNVEVLLGASTLITRFGGFVFNFLWGKVLELVGYGGAGLTDTVLLPRAAAAASAHALAAQRHDPTVPVAASWNAITGKFLATEGAVCAPSWAQARGSLGLNARQAVWSCGAKMLLWHWAQSLSYFAVFGLNYCVVSQTQRIMGAIVACREVAYLISTLLALRFNPAYLLLELDGVLESTQHASGRTSWWHRINWASLHRSALYILASHQYVMLCLMRCTGQSVLLGVCARLVALVMFFADYVSAWALYTLLGPEWNLYSEEYGGGASSFPTPLVFGYWLTTAGLIPGMVGTAIVFAQSSWRGVVVSSGTTMGFGQRILFGVFAIVFMLVAVWGIFLLAIAPLQLSYAVRGLGCPGGLFC